MQITGYGLWQEQNNRYSARMQELTADGMTHGVTQNEPVMQARVITVMCLISTDFLCRLHIMKMRMVQSEEFLADNKGFTDFPTIF